MGITRRRAQLSCCWAPWGAPTCRRPWQCKWSSTATTTATSRAGVRRPSCRAAWRPRHRPDGHPRERSETGVRDGLHLCPDQGQPVARARRRSAGTGTVVVRAHRSHERRRPCCHGRGRSAADSSGRAVQLRGRQPRGRGNRGTVCRDFPQKLVLVDHFGSTGAATPFSGEGWQRLLALSKFSNAHVKVSGWHPHATPNAKNPRSRAKTSIQAAGDATLELISYFGAERLLFAGSNFPIGAARMRLGTAERLCWRTMVRMRKSGATSICGVQAISQRELDAGAAAARHYQYGPSLSSRM
jgi:hypothetical protein